MIRITLTALLLTTAAGCGSNSSKIVGKWRPINDLGHERQIIEFFVDGKVNGGFGELVDYRVDGDRLIIGRNGDSGSNRPGREQRFVFSFPDADHLDLTPESSAQDAAPVQGSAIRYERVKDER
jgi:hypothetical protein